MEVTLITFAAYELGTTYLSTTYLFYRIDYFYGFWTTFIKVRGQLRIFMDIHELYLFW